MIRHYEGKEVMNDDVIITEYLYVRGHEYRIEKYFCGGIDEDGEEFLEGSCFCEISVYEIVTDDHKAVEKIAEEYDGNIIVKPVMICAPQERYVATVMDESSLADTEEMYEEIIKIIEEIG